MTARRSGVGGSEPDAHDAASATSVSADDLDKMQLDQLHAATLKATESCFELKKLCATVLVPTAALVSVFTDKRLNSAVFGAGLIVVGAFWMADSVGYFYQRKLRAAMTVIWERRAARCKNGYVYVPRPTAAGALRAAFNASMLYYLILAFTIALGWVLLTIDIVGSSPSILQ